MREDMGLYRGKLKDTGEWVEGYLTYRYRYDQQSRKEILGPVIDCPQEVTLGNTTGKVICSYQVVPGTEGQFTGLTDKNGKKIFEGDVVKAERICNGKAWQGSVVWWNGCFAIQGIKDRNFPPIDLFVEYEVIGNIHDNPELLEVSK